MKFSIIIPTYNEEKDIAETLDRLLSIPYKDKEIIVVDDSTDSTPIIVQKYIGNVVRLLKPEIRRGRCEARNMGIRAATGDVVIILNADVHLPMDFLDKIKKYYDEGADFVCVNAEIENWNNFFARYIECSAKLQLADNDFVINRMLWTEGFSVRRSIVLKTSLFPTGFLVPIAAGEDGFFGEQLIKIGAKKIVDMSIIVTHLAPGTFKTYWYTRKGRGEGTPQIRRFLDKWPFRKIFFRATAKAITRFIISITVFPMLYLNFKFAGYSKKNRITETFLFSFAWLIEQIAMSVGEFESLRLIMAGERRMRHR